MSGSGLPGNCRYTTLFNVAHREIYGSNYTFNNKESKDIHSKKNVNKLADH